MTRRDLPGSVWRGGWRFALHLRLRVRAARWSRYRKAAASRLPARPSSSAPPAPRRRPPLLLQRSAARPPSFAAFESRCRPTGRAGAVTFPSRGRPDPRRRLPLVEARRLPDIAAFRRRDQRRNSRPIRDTARRGGALRSRLQHQLRRRRAAPGADAARPRPPRRGGAVLLALGRLGVRLHLRPRERAVLAQRAGADHRCAGGLGRAAVQPRRPFDGRVPADGHLRARWRGSATTRSSPRSTR